MEAHRIDCCRSAKRRGWTAGALTFAALAALAPKCPLCIAGWLAVLGVSGLAAHVDPRALLLAAALAMTAASALVVYRLFKPKES